MTFLFEYAYLITFIGAVIAAGGVLLAAHKQAEFERQLRVKNEEIAELNRRIANTITGGDSHARLGLMLDPGNFGWVWIVVVQKGDFPVYDVQVQLRNLTRQWDMTQAGVKEGRVYFSWDQIEKETEWTFNVGNLGPARYRTLAKLRLPDERGEQDFEGVVTSRNDVREYEFWFRLIDKKWIRAHRVRRGQEVLEFDVPAVVPRDEQGEPSGTAGRMRPWPVPLP